LRQSGGPEATRASPTPDIRGGGYGPGPLPGPQEMVA